MSLMTNKYFNELSLEEMNMIEGGWDPFSAVDSFIDGLTGKTVNEHAKDAGSSLKESIDKYGVGWGIFDWVSGPATPAY